MKRTCFGWAIWGKERDLSRSAASAAQAFRLAPTFALPWALRIRLGEREKKLSLLLKTEKGQVWLGAILFCIPQFKNSSSG